MAPLISRRFVVPLAALMLPPVVQADVTKASNTTALNLPASYVENVLPSPTDLIIYNNTVTAANTTALGGNLSIFGLRVLNPTGAVTISATASSTLALGAGGIDMSAATSDLTIAAALASAGAQNWTVQTGRVLTVSGGFADGGDALTLNGVGTYRGGVNNAFGTGTLNLNANLIFATNDGTARTFGNTLVNIGGNITFGQGTGGTGAITFNGASAVFDLGAATRTFNTAQNTTFAGIIQGAAGVGITKSGGNALILNGANTYSGATSITAGSLRVNNALATVLPNSNVAFGGANTFLHSSVAATAVGIGTGAGQLQFGAFASGFGAVGVNSTFTLNGGVPVSWGMPGFVQTNQQLLFGGANSTSTAIIATGLDLSGAAATGGVMRVIAPTDAGPAYEGDLAGALSGMSGLNLAGTGALRLSGSIGHQGGTFVNSGVLGFDNSFSAPANLSTGAIEPIANLITSNSSAFAYSGAAATIPATFFGNIADIGSAITVAAVGPNNATGNYTTNVDFNLAPASMRSKLYLGGTAASAAAGTGGGATLTGTFTPVDGTYRVGGGTGVLIFGTANQLTGANNVMARTGGVVRVNNVAQNLTGTITVDGGIFELNGNAANISTAGGVIVNGVGNLVNAAAVNGYGSSITFFAKLRGGVFGLQNMKDPTGTLVGTQNVTLRGGALAAHDSDGTSGTILVQNVIADYGYTQIAHQPQGAASTHDQLTVTQLSRNFGATAEFRSTFGPLATATGDNGNIVVTNIGGSPAANTNGIVGGWALATEGAASTANNNEARNFATVTANGIDAYAQEYTTAAATTLAAALTSSNVLATGTTGGTASAHNIITTNQTINSLITEAAINVTSGATLTIGTGGLIMRQTQNFAHSTDSTGKLTSGLPSGELFVYGDPTTNDDHRITSLAIVDNGATPVHLIKGGAGSITLGGIDQNNTFTGQIVVNLGMLRFDFRGLGTVLPSGAGNTITVRSGGTFSTALANTAPRTVTNNVLLDGGTLANDATGGGTSSSVTYEGTIDVRSVPGSTATISANGAANMNIVLGPTSTLTGGGNLTKTGAQALDIQTANVTGYTGSVFVTSGIMQASGSGLLPNTDYFLTGGTLGVTTTNQTVKNLTGTGGNISGATGGTDSLTVVQTVDAAYHGQISQTQITKQGNAHLYLTGTGDNSSGTVQLDSGVLTLAKASTNAVHVIGSGGLGLTVNNGTLRLGGNYTNTGGGGVNLPPTNAPANYVDQIYYQTEVQLNGGTVDLSGLSESVDGLSGSAPAVITNGIAATTSTLFTGQDNAGGTFGGVMQDGAGTLAYAKLGSGTQTLSGANTFTGSTEVQGGTLSVTGALSGSAVTVRSLARLNGDGPLGGLITESGATVEPGVGSIASLAILGNVTLGGGSVELALNGTAAGVSYDQITATGTVGLTANTNLVLSLGFTPMAFVDNFTIFDNTGLGGIGGPGLFAVGGTPLNDGDTFTVGGSLFRIQYDGGTGNDVVLETVPEPGSLALLFGGVGMIVASRRRKRA